MNFELSSPDVHASCRRALEQASTFNLVESWQIEVRGKLQGKKTQ
jgi:hypothetical protein